MTRLEIICEMQVLESRKEVFEALKHDVNDCYCEEVYIVPQLISKAFESNRKYHGEKQVKVDKEIFLSYIATEIMRLDKQINKLIGELK